MCWHVRLLSLLPSCRFKGMRQPARTFLLHGQPGTGKTLLVEKVAAEAGFMLLSVSPSMILSKWAGDSEKAISGVFDIARSFQPAIIFLVRELVQSVGMTRFGCCGLQQPLTLLRPEPQHGMYTSLHPHAG